MSYIEDYLAKMPDFEGNIPFLFRDSVGQATCGQGCMLPNVDASFALQWYSGERPAEHDEVVADWNRVMAIKIGYAALGYKSGSSLTLPQSEIDMQARVAVGKVDAELTAALPDFYTYPDSVKLGLLDLGFNLGVQGMIRGFPKMMQCVHAQNWQGVMAQCNRPQLSLPRNDWTRQCFQEAI